MRGGGTVAQRLTLLLHSSRDPGSNPGSGHCLCGVLKNYLWQIKYFIFIITLNRRVNNPQCGLTLALKSVWIGASELRLLLDILTELTDWDFQVAARQGWPRVWGSKQSRREEFERKDWPRRGRAEIGDVGGASYVELNQKGGEVAAFKIQLNWELECPAPPGSIFR